VRLVSDPGVNSLRGVVDGLTYAGATIEVAVRLECGTMLRLVRPSDAPRPAPGEAVRVGWDADAVLLLDR